MKRYPLFATAALLLLLLVLLGSWVYLKNFDWPVGGGGSAADQDAVARDAAENLDAEPFAADPDAETTGPGNGTTEGNRRPLEAPPEEIRRAPPPDPVETGKGAVSEAAADVKPKDEIVAELVSGTAGVTDGKGSEDGLDPFIVSTLLSPMNRLLMSLDGLTSFGAKDKQKADDDAVDAPAEFGALTGEIVWPALDKDTDAELDKERRLQAVVYLERLPEFRVIVEPEHGHFRLALTEKLQDEYRSKGLRLVVHSPAFELAGGFEAVMVKKDDGPIKLTLQEAPAISVIVDVVPKDAVQSGVRVWLERRGSGPDRDDCLYMSAKVPPSGRLHFAVPEHYGEIRVAATGAAWHSGLPQVQQLRDWKTTKINIKLNLAADPCERVGGTVKVDSDTGNAITAARLESTHYGTTVYTGPDGRFSMYVPYDGNLSRRQFLATKQGLRPEVVSLERGGTSSPGVEGEAVEESAMVKMAGSMTLELNLPREASHWTQVQVSGSEAKEVSAGRVAEVKLSWGQRFVHLVDPGGGYDPVAAYVGPDDWDYVFKLYAGGHAQKASLRMKTVEDVFKKR